MLEHVPKCTKVILIGHILSKKNNKYDAYFGNGDIDSPEKALQYKMNTVSTVS
jgi:hypothetical protein